MGTGSFSRGYIGQGVVLTAYPHLRLHDVLGGDLYLYK